MTKKVIRAEENTTLTISLPKEMAAAVKRYCDQNDIKASQYIRRLVRDDAGSQAVMLTAETKAEYKFKKPIKKAGE